MTFVLDDGARYRRVLEAIMDDLAYVISDWDAQEELPDDVEAAFDVAGEAVSLIQARLYMRRRDAVVARRCAT